MVYDVKKKYPRSSQDLHLDRKVAGMKANQSTMDSPRFKKACEMASVEPTRRQASKFRQGRGAASNLG